MPRRTMGFRQTQALDDYSKLENLTALENLWGGAFPDATAQVPGTLPEKLVLNYLKRLRVRFSFQYHLADNPNTAYPESVYVPDFTLPDYNSHIEVFGEYWHTLGTQRSRDLEKMSRHLYDGRAIIERGIPIFPEGGGFDGKLVIWWEQEIYFDLAHLFARDLPELLLPQAVPQDMQDIIFDTEQAFRKREDAKSRMSANKMRPRVNPYLRQLRRLRKKTTDLSKTYNIKRFMEGDPVPKLKNPYETRGRKKEIKYY